jgi:hypothetical protein
VFCANLDRPEAVDRSVEVPIPRIFGFKVHNPPRPALLEAATLSQQGEAEEKTASEPAAQQNSSEGRSLREEPGLSKR